MTRRSELNHIQCEKQHKDASVAIPFSTLERWHSCWSLVAPFAMAFVLTLIVCVVFSQILDLPYPQIHDEYSYCLAGETFARGRLTNPTHPMAEHFETMHVLQHPSYMSKYPPEQGIVLAIGRWLGHPMFGVWLSFALACAAMSWAMSAVVDNIWAVVGSVLFAFSMNCVSYMFQIGYWAHMFGDN